MTRRVVGFVDGQNLFYAAKQAFGYTYPNYDPRRLTEVVADAQGWTVAGIIKMACAFPVSPTYPNRRGIDKTDWIRLDQATYDLALDPRDYRPKTVRG